MSSRITTVIPQQNFELIASKVATIILTEFANQIVLEPLNTIFSIDKIWLERFIPFDKTEMPAINVFYNSSTYTDNTPHNSLGDSKFSIEVITNAKHTSNNDGDLLAAQKLHRLIGAIRYILKHPAYLSLDLQKFVFYTQVESIRIGQPTQSGEGLHAISGLITFNVRLRENNGDISGISLEKQTTTFLIDNSNKGYYIYIDNLPN